MTKRLELQPLHVYIDYELNVLEERGLIPPCSVFVLGWTEALYQNQPTKEILMKNNDRSRFNKKWSVEPVSGCWTWNAGCGSGGYGIFYMGGRSYRAHRVAYSMWVGPIPDGMSICHHCDVTICVNPNHLFLGTHRDNIADSIKKGRRVDVSKGEANGNSILTEGQVREIRKRAIAGVSKKKLAESYDVSAGAIYDIIARRNWGWLT